MNIKSMPILKKYIGEHICHSRKWKGVDFDVFVIKYPNYNMMMMSTYSGIMVCNDQKEEYQFSRGQILTFNYA